MQTRWFCRCGEDDGRVRIGVLILNPIFARNGGRKGGGERREGEAGRGRKIEGKERRGKRKERRRGRDGERRRSMGWEEKQKGDGAVKRGGGG